MAAEEEKNYIETPQVSVIMPAYNAEATLKASAESVLGQSMRELELIIVDDGSKDATPSVGKALAESDPRVRFVSQPNSGPAAARNRGFDMARGKYVTLADSDDLLDPDMLKVMLEAAESTGADTAVCGASIEYPNGGGADREARFGAEGLFSGEKLKGLFDLEGMTIFFSGWGKLYKRSIVEENGLRMDNSYRITEDSDFAMRYLENCRSVYLVDRCFYRYMQVNGASLTSVKDPEALKTAAFNIASRLRSLMLKWGMDEAEARKRADEYLFGQLNSAAFIKLRSGAPRAEKKAFYNDVISADGIKSYLRKGKFSSRMLALGFSPAMAYTRLHSAYLKARGKQ